MGMGKVLVAACLCGIIVVCGAFSPVLLQPASPPASRSTFLSSSVFLGWRLGGRAGAGNPIGLGAGGGGIAASPRQRHAVGGLSMAGPGGAKPYQSAGGSGGGKKTRNRKARAERRKAGGFILEDGAGPVGKAKQNILLKKVKEQEDRMFNWEKLRDKLNSERDVTGFPEGWQGGQKDLTEKQKMWNADLYGGGKADEEDDNGVTDTNVNAWKQVRNKETGDVYFWNIETDETSWEVPEGIVTDVPLSEFRGVTKTIPSPAGIDGVLWLCTQHTTGHAHYGCFFQVDAKDEDVWIIGIRTGAHYRSDIYESKYRVFVKDGPVYGNEISKEGWTQYGFKQVKAEIRKVGPKKWDYMGLSREIKSSASSREELLPCICETDSDPETLYGAVPLERAIHIPAGTSKGLCIWCEDSMGIILRKKEPYMPTGGKGGKKIRRVEGGYFAKGEVTDENAHLVIKAGLVPRKDVFRSVVSQEAYAAFTGVLEYSLDSGKVPERSSNDAEAEGEQFEPSSAGVVEIELAGQEGVDDEEAVGEAVSKLRVPEEAVKFPEEVDKEVIRVDLSAPLLQEEKEEEEEEEEEIDMEALLDGPGENIFGGDGDQGGGTGYEPTGEFSLLCYVKDEEVAEMSITKDTSWKEACEDLRNLTGPDVAFTYQMPDGSGEEEVRSPEAWKKLIGVLVDEEVELEGVMEIDISIQSPIDPRLIADNDD